MKYLKLLGLAAVAAMALMAFAAGSASASGGDFVHLALMACAVDSSSVTTLEVGGVTQEISVTIGASFSQAPRR
jgi:hypothetical protein